MVRCGLTLSDVFSRENGVPQGSGLIVTLFCLAINQVFSVIEPPMNEMLYADDIILFSEGECTETLQEHLQNILNRVFSWLENHGLKVSITKKVGILYRKKCTGIIHSLTINECPIKTENTVKFLGLTYDRTLSWEQHILELKEKAQRALLKTVSNTKWGADRSSMLMLYKSLFPSRLDYGCIAYGSASENFLKR